MIRRDIIKTLLNHDVPERMGLHEHFWPFICENAWAEQGIPEGTDFTRRFDLDLESIFWLKFDGPRPDLAAVVDESDEWVVQRDGWGASTKNWKAKA